MNKQAEMNPYAYSLEAALEQVLRICNDYDLPEAVKDRYYAPEVKYTETDALADAHMLELCLKAIAEHVETGGQA